MDNLTFPQICAIIVLSLVAAIFPIKKVHATPAADCAVASSFSSNWLTNAKTALSTAGYSPDFNSSTNQAMFAKLDSGAFAFYLAESEVNINLENPTLYSMQPKVAGVGGYGYRVIMQADGTANPGPARFYVASAGANQSGLACVQGIKNMTLTAPTVTESQKKFPFSNGTTPFGNATFFADPNAPPPTNQELTLRDEKIIALGVTGFISWVCIKPFVWRSPRE